MTTHERDEKLKAICTDEFLANLEEVNKLCATTEMAIDHDEVRVFVEKLNYFMGKEPPELKLYEIED